MSMLRRAVIRLLRELADAPNLSASFVAVRVETENTSPSEERTVSPQRLCDSAERRCRKASFYFAAQSRNAIH